MLAQALILIFAVSIGMLVFLHDPRLDLWTTLMLNLVQMKQRNWHKPVATAFKIPTVMEELEKFKLPNTQGIDEFIIPIHDEVKIFFYY